jgi:hypothetical protein
MQEREPKVGIAARRDERIDLDAEVTIQFAPGTIAGSGQNISAQGVFFTAEASLPVTVRIKGRGEIAGSLVRLESMGDGRIGIAVRFHQAHPQLVADADGAVRSAGPAN